ncbi:Mariner Mos1 transposase [Pelomyxa schiedti]|nr:Mariner Mos1 transposase [Pelomyxa schiedti]
MDDQGAEATTPTTSTTTATTSSTSSPTAPPPELGAVEWEAEWGPAPGGAAGVMEARRGPVPLAPMPPQRQQQQPKGDPPPAAYTARRAVGDAVHAACFLWNRVTFRLPESALAVPKPPKGEEAKTKSPLFQRPQNDDLNRIAMGSDGRKKLNATQLSQIRAKAEFDVPSVNFPGQFHLWKLSRLVQTGHERVNGALVGSMAAALRVVVVWMPNRIIGNFFSVKNGIKNILRGVRGIADLLVGLKDMVPAMNNHQREREIELQRKRFQLRDFMPLPTVEPMICHRRLDDFMLDLRLFMIKSRSACEDNAKDAHMRLFWTTLHDAVVEAEEQWKVVKHVFCKQVQESMTKEELLELTPGQLADKCAVEFNRLLREKILEVSEKLEALYPHITQQLLQHLDCVRLIFHLSALHKEKRDNHEQEVSRRLKAEYPLFSRIPEWFARNLSAAMAQYDRIHEKEDFESTLKLLKDSNECKQQAFLIDKEAEFIYTQQSAIAQELARRVVPFKFIRCTRVIWNPANWKIKEVPSDSLKKRYTIRKHTQVKIYTDKLFWRVRALFHRTGYWLLNTWYGIIVLNMWMGPLSLQSLFRIKKYPAGLDFDWSTGKLSPSKTELGTLASRVSAAWTSAFKSRSDFESAPDLGFLGKNVSRIFNAIWNYLIKGSLSTALIVTCQPPLTLLNLLLSTLLVPSAVLYVPVAVVVSHLYRIWLYDSNSITRTNWFPLIRYLWRIVVTGVLQSSSAILATLTIHPLTAALHSGYGLLRWLINETYDTLMYYTIVKHIARVPAANTFMARRIAGPGLSSSLFFQIAPENALLALHLHMEHRELDMYRAYTEHLLREPQRALENLFVTCLHPYAAILDTNHELSRAINENVHSQIQELEKLIMKRRKRLPQDSDMGNVKLSKTDLFRTINMAAQFLEDFVPRHLFQYQKSPIDYWSSLNLAPNDWHGLARHYLAQTFTAGFLVPLEDNDQRIKLKVQHTTVGGYLSMVKEGDWHDDLDNFVVSMAASLPECHTELQLDNSFVCNPYQQPPHPASVRVWQALLPLGHPPFDIDTIENKPKPKSRP